MAYSLEDLRGDVPLPAGVINFGDSAVLTYLNIGPINVSIQKMIDRNSGGTVSFSSSTYTVGESAGNLVVTINRAIGFNNACTGEVNIAHVTTSAADLTTTMIPFSMGHNVTSTTISIPITSDTDVESNETFTITMNNVTNADVVIGTATCTIVDDDVAAALADTWVLTQASTDVNEGDAYTFRIERTGDTTGAITVDLAVSGTGTEGTDYDTIPSTLTIAAGQVGVDLVINTTTDNEIEGDENFTITISNPTVGTILNQVAATCVIKNVSAVSTVAMDVSSMAVPESGSANIVVQRTGTYGACSVDVTTTTGTADSNDFEVATKTLNWAEGESGAKTAAFTITEDSLIELDETFTATINNPSGCTIDGTSETIVTITNDDFTSMANFRVAGSRNTSMVTGTATAGFSLTSDGRLTTFKNSSIGSDTIGVESDFDATSWYALKPSVGIGDDYEVRVTVTDESGVASLVGTRDTWLSLSAHRSWEIAKSSSLGGESISHANVLVEIRDSTSLVVVASSTGQVTAMTFGV